MTAIKPKFDIEKLNLHYGAFHALEGYQHADR